MSPNLERAMEKRSPEFFDNQGFESTEKESLGLPRTHSYPLVQAVHVHVQPTVRVRKRTQIFAALAGEYTHMEAAVTSYLMYLFLY